MKQLPLLSAAVVITFKSQSGREFRHAIVRIHFNAVILATSLIRRFKGSFISRAVESEELVKAITDAFECTSGSVHYAVCPTGCRAVLLCLAYHLFWDFDKAMDNVTDGTTQLAG